MVSCVTFDISARRLARSSLSCSHVETRAFIFLSVSDNEAADRDVAAPGDATAAAENFGGGLALLARCPYGLCMLIANASFTADLGYGVVKAAFDDTDDDIVDVDGANV